MAGFLDLLKKTNVQPPNLLASQKNFVRVDKAAAEQVFYPADLFSSQNQAYILFQRRDPVARGSKITAGIGLYMPPEIRVSYGANWEPIQMTALQYVDMGKDAFNNIRNLYNSSGFTGDLTKLIASSIKGGAIGRSFANLLDSVSSGSNFGQQLETATGKTVNPHMALLFKGVEFRTFEFSFKMMAKDKTESDSIRDIIKQFKSAMHPKFEDGSARYWIYPDNFDIYLFTTMNDDSAATQYMFQIDTAALTNMSVNYAGSGIPVFFDDSGAPVQIEMTLQFQELGIMTREKVEEGY